MPCVSQADSQGHVSHNHELMSRVWPVNAYFLQELLEGSSDFVTSSIW